MTPHSTELKEKMRNLAERYFGDMRLKRDSIVEKFFWVTLENDDGFTLEDKKKIENGEMKDWKIENGKLCQYELPDEISQVLNVDNFRYVVGELEDETKAETNLKTHTVTVAPEYVKDNTVLLHELIHVFEWFYRPGNEPYENQYGTEVNPYIPPFIRDVLFINLYNDVNKRIKAKYSNEDLDLLILYHAHYVFGVQIALQGGNHDVLFYLKSLDLDLRLGFPLGTVCGYGRGDHSFASP